ncbi:hypothetical protein LFL97_23470 [Burkholderia sp. JSH-S8]|nr:hypothetical protein LFL97_23470 [Burkholderia sp. JSH-S8]
MEKTQALQSNRDGAHASTQAHVSQAPICREPLLCEDAENLAKFNADVARQTHELVECVRRRAALAAERRVLEVARRLVDEREQAAKSATEFRQVITELWCKLKRAEANNLMLSSQLQQVQAENRAMKSHLDCWQAFATALARLPAPVISPLTTLIFQKVHRVQTEVTQLSLIRYRIDRPWRSDITGRPYTIPVTEPGRSS